VVPDRPGRQIERPHARALGAARFDLGEPVVERNVEGHRHENTAEEIEKAAGE
jgi:hypothetical protein